MKTLLLGGVVLALGLLPATAGAQANGEKVEISAFAVDMSTIGAGANAMVDITVDR